MPSPLEAFQVMIESLNSAEEPSFALILDLLYRTKYSGGITVHCDRGVPQHVEFGRPMKIDLTRRQHKA
jgi:hypothetical protein